MIDTLTQGSWPRLLALPGTEGNPEHDERAWRRFCQEHEDEDGPGECALAVMVRTALDGDDLGTEEKSTVDVLRYVEY